MSASPSIEAPGSPSAGQGGVRDFVTLMKLRLNVMVLVATTTAYYMAAGNFGDSAWQFPLLLLCVLLAAAGSSSINMALEADLDRQMNRTKNRPVAAGRLTVRQAVIFGAVLSTIGVIGVRLLSNELTAVLTGATVLLYVLAYTPLKTRSTLNTVVGAVPGAIPAVLGWTAATNSIGYEGAVLFGILFFWQFPHFYAIATMYREDYARGGFAMLPVLDRSGMRTAWQILSSALALVPIGMLPSLPLGRGNIPMTGGVYAVGALVLGILYLYASIKAVTGTDDGRWRRLLRVSLLILPGYYLLMVIDRAGGAL